MLSHAISFAAKAHEGQKRKGSGLPYVTHPLEVMVLLIHHGVRDEAVLAAAVLHDVVEDCAVAEAQVADSFGEDVARIVAALTKGPGPSDTETKRRALEQVRRGPKGAKSVKMADRLSNIRDLEAIAWPREKKAAYLREALEISEIGAGELPALSATLVRVAREQRELLPLPSA